MSSEIGKENRENTTAIVDNSEHDASAVSNEIKTSSLTEPQHELEYRWTYWYLNDKRDMHWEKRLKNITTFGTVEQFWGLYLNIRPPSLLHNTCDYSVFKEGIQPMWEVKENTNGGRWLITIDKMRHVDLLDTIWLEVLLAVIGGQFGEYTKDICGIVVNIRNKGSKISIWTTNANNDESNKGIGEILKKTLTNPEIEIKGPMFDVLRYEEHREVQNKNSSSVKAKFVLAVQD